MKKLMLLSAATVIIALAACKKNNTTNSNTNSTAPFSNTGTPSATITPIALQNFSNASFTFFSYQTLFSTNPLNMQGSSYGEATFFTGTNTSNQGKISVQAVFLDSAQLNFNSNNISYTSPNVSVTNCTWQVYGAGNIPSFTYASNQVPVLLNYLTLPDTINRAQAASIFVQFSTGRASSIIIARPNQTNISSNANINSSADTATITFTAANLSTLSAGTGTLSIYADKYDQESVNGIPMLFYNKKTFNKIIYLK